MPPPLPHRVPIARRAHRRVKAGDAQALSQGELDGLCGLYAGINAVRLLFALDHPLTGREEKALFDAGIRYLDAQGILADAAIGGFDPQTWEKVLAATALEVAAIGRPITITMPLRTVRRPTLANMFAIIEAAVAAHQIVLIELSGTYQHFTVVSGVGPNKLALFDSGVLCWLRRQNCVIVKTKKRARHIINPRSLCVGPCRRVPETRNLVL